MSLAERIVECFPADGLETAVAYGSGIFDQVSESGAKDSTSESNGQHVEDAGKLLDFLLVVDDAAQWHAANMKRHEQHYSRFVRWCGPEGAAWLQGLGPGNALFNTSVEVAAAPGVRIKYGVMSTADLCADLTHWTSMYASGRLHKPVRFVKRPSQAHVRAALSTNLRHAVHASLLLLPETFSEEELFRTITSLSYTGDIRMRLAENPHKVDNIVRGSLPRFQHLYRGFLPGGSASPAAGFLGKVWEEAGSGGLSLRQDMDPSRRQDMASALPIPAASRAELQASLRSRVAASSRLQSAKGLLTVDPLTALSYAVRKVTKRFK